MYSTTATPVREATVHGTRCWHLTGYIHICEELNVLAAPFATAVDVEAIARLGNHIASA